MHNFLFSNSSTLIFKNSSRDFDVLKTNTEVVTKVYNLAIFKP